MKPFTWWISRAFEVFVNTFSTSHLGDFLRNPRFGDFVRKSNPCFRDGAFYDIYKLLKVRKLPKREVDVFTPAAESEYATCFHINERVHLATGVPRSYENTPP